jgi:hypothetical protein
MKMMILASVMTVSVPSFAVPASSFLGKMLPQKQTKTERIAGCEDFSGSWKGVCSTNGGDLWETDLAIDQLGCGQIAFVGSINGSYNIGGLTTVTHAEQDSAESYSLAFKWAGNKLEGRLQGTTVDIPKRMPYVATGSHLMYKDQDELIQKTSLKVDEWAFDVNCSYSK